MAFPLLIADDARPEGGDDVAIRFTTRRHDNARRHNPHVDAAWWPRSSNLTVELAGLLEAARASGFEATRVMYRLGDAWTAPRRRVVFGARRVKVSGYHNHHRYMITLVDGASHERLQVMVVPSDTPPPLAVLALRIAADDADPTPGADILARARDTLRAQS